jgi:uncharacterized protein (TIGR02444 family)
VSALWAFAVQAWRRPGVAAVALELQDAHGLPPALLLWRFWALDAGVGVDERAATRAVEIAGAWQADVLGPLREVRQRLKSPPAPLDAFDATGLRDRILAVELDAERALLEALESLVAGNPGASAEPPTEPLAALSALATAWRPPLPLTTLTCLVDFMRGDAPADVGGGGA